MDVHDVLNSFVLCVRSRLLARDPAADRESAERGRLCAVHDRRELPAHRRLQEHKVLGQIQARSPTPAYTRPTTHPHPTHHTHVQSVNLHTCAFVLYISVDSD